MRRSLITVAATTLVLLGIAGPAAADHYIEATPTGCFGGAIATGTFQNLTTDRVRIRTDRSGATTWTCTFTGVGSSTGEENGYSDYVVPTRSVRYTSIDGCWETDAEGFPVRVADALIRARPDGSIRVSCTLPAPG